MQHNNPKLRSGDLVEVRTPSDILKTLDDSGTLGLLPFMPEMLDYCGGQFRVAKRVVKICTSGTKEGSTLRGFESDDVVLLEGLRCAGTAHDGCQKLCTIFWREAWLRKVDEADAPVSVPPAEVEQSRARLKTRNGSKYFCQASELSRSTKALSKRERYTKWISDIRCGNTTSLEMARRMGIFLFWKTRRVFFGPYAKRNNKATPAESLNLQAGDLVEIKPMESIAQTLDDTASNRGLWFSPNMRLLCGQRRRVQRRIDKLIVDGTGEMRQLRNTVFLEGSHCGCAHIAFGGCSRCEFVYWREIWLRRCDNNTTAKDGAESC